MLRTTNEHQEYNQRDFFVNSYECICCKLSCVLPLDTHNIGMKIITIIISMNKYDWHIDNSLTPLDTKHINFGTIDIFNYRYQLVIYKWRALHSFCSFVCSCAG